MAETIRSIEAFKLPPESGGTVKAFSRIGYDLAEALADVVDNALDADASRVEVTFNRDDDRIISVTIADNGKGMSQPDLRTAMRFAATTQRRKGALGVFGLGMKSASLSQCRSLTVLSSSGAEVAGCRWTVEAIADDWQCDFLEKDGAGLRYGAAYAGGAPSTGTVVLWERLDQMDVTGGEEGLDEYLAETMTMLDLRLGLTFHRFIGPKFGIVLRTSHERRPSLPRRVRAYDPFGYPASGRKGYPKVFKAHLPDGAELNLHAHIWPYDSRSPNFLIGRRKATAHQGFYFYRNSRLIQAGGWNGVLKDVTDPELGLARVAVEIGDAPLETNVQKSSVQSKAALSAALEHAGADGVTFKSYLDEARRAYRSGRRKPEAGKSVPAVPAAGLPVALQRSMRSALAKDGPAREIDFVWESLPKKKVFEVEPSADRIVLNRKYRQELLGGNPASGADAPLMKTLLFLLLEDELDRSRITRQHQAWLDRCNQVLLQFVRSQ